MVDNRFILAISILFLTYSWLGSVTAEDKDTSVQNKENRDLLEKEVLGLRVWMIIGIVGLGLSIVVVVLCCIFDCRIPRSKAEIEAEHENAQLIKQYKDTIERIPKGKKVKVIKAIPTSALPGMALAKPQDREAQAGTSTELTDSGDASSSTPLAQHPSTLLTGGNEPHLRKPLGATNMRLSLVATVRTLASMQQLQKKVQKKHQQREVVQETA